MINNTKNGWCDFDLGDFHGHPSYLTDVAMDLVTACYRYCIEDNDYITVGFDEEDSEFILLADYHNCYINFNYTFRPINFSNSSTIFRSFYRKLCTKKQRRCKNKIKKIHR